MTPYSEGYFAGTVNERDNPHPLWMPLSRLAWEVGNDFGVRAHCAMVEAAVRMSEL